MRFQKTILFLLLFGVAFPVFSQSPTRVRHADELFYIEPSTDVFIQGGLEHLKDNDNTILNQGQIHLSDSLVNDAGIYIFGTLPDTLGHVYFTGNSLQGIGGNPIYLSNVTFRNSFDSLELNTDTLFVNQNLILDSGNLHLNGNQLFLTRTTYAGSIVEGTLVNEDADDNVYGYPGFIRIFRPLASGQTFTDLHGTDLDLKSEGNLGAMVDIRRYNEEQTASNGSVTKFYHFDPEISDDISTVGFEYLDPNDLNGNDESKLALYISHNSGLSYRDNGGSADPGNNKLTNSLLFTISDQTRITLSSDTCDSLPPVQMPADTLPLCDGLQTAINPTGLSGMEILWSTGAQNVDSITVDTSGQYWVRITDDRGCINFDTIDIVDAPLPNVGFSHDFACIGDSTVFTDTTSITSMEALTYSWDFGDPFKSTDTSSLQHPKYRFTQFGTFPVALTVVSASGCEASTSKNVVVLPYPTADFSTSSVCTGDTAVFTNSSTIPGSAGITYLWYFGDGDSSTVLNPSHVYDTTDTFQVQLLASSNGCTDTSELALAMHPNPIADFVVDNNCEGDQVLFMNGSVISAGSLTYQWNIDSQSASTDANPLLIYTDPGMYGVTLTATSNNGCIDSTADTLEILARPVAAFSASSVCDGDSTHFTNNSTVSAGLLTYEWDFGNTTSNLLDPANLFGNNGAFPVKLVAESDSGCRDSVTQIININPTPVASFNFTDECDGTTVNFQNSSIISAGNLSYRWLFTTTDSSLVEHPGFSFPNDGLFDVELVATSDSSCTDTLVQTIEIYPNPLVDLGGDTVTTCGTTLVLDAQNAGNSFAWSNGQTTQTVTANFNGLYNVTVTDNNNCTGADTAYIQLNSPVIPSLGPDLTVCDSVLITSGYPQPGNSFQWSTGDTTNNLVPTSTATIFLTITDQNNCQGFDTIDITVNNSPMVDLGPDQTECDGILVPLDAQNPGSTFAWSNGSTDQILNVGAGGTFRVTVTDVNNCSDVDTATISFNPLPVFALGPDALFCDSVTLVADANADSYSWSGGETNDSLQVSTSGTYSCEASLVSGCTFSDTIVVTIGISPIVEIGTDTTICANASLTLDAQNPGDSYAWSTGETTQTLGVLQSGQYRVTVTTPEGCSTADIIQITKNVTLKVDLGQDFILCSGATYSVAANIDSGNYVWGGDHGFTGNTKRVTISDSGSYWVQVTDEFGCLGFDTIVASPTNLNLEANFLAKTTNPVGDTIKFINLSTPVDSYTSFWDMGDGFTTTGQHPIHAYFLADQFYDVTLAVTNGVCFDTLTKEIYVGPLKNDVPEPVDTEGIYNNFLSSVLYPNPNRGTFTLEVELLLEDELFMEVYNLQGVLVGREKQTGKNIRQEFNYSNLASGMYFVRCFNGEASKSLKFIVTK